MAKQTLRWSGGESENDIPLIRLLIPAVIVLWVGLFAVDQFTLMKGTVTIDVGEVVVASDFVNHGKDRARFAEGGDDFDTYVPGIYPVTIQYGLVRRHGTLLVVDRMAPRISSDGDFTATLGDTIRYRDKVAVTDNCDPEPKLEVDSYLVRANEVGTYPVVYTARDATGNESTEILWVTIEEYKPEEQADAMTEEVYGRADAILASILSDDMSQRDRAWAIFQYIRAHVGYISYSEKGDVIRAAREGLLNGRGDCYVFYATAKVLLDRAGILNAPIERTPLPGNDTMHYWNLVDVGDGHGWYHFDTTPTTDHVEVFLWTDAQVRAYSEQRTGYYLYDAAKYPGIQ